MNIENLISEYSENIPLYESYVKKLSALLKEILEGLNIDHVIDYRVKDIKHFEEKISREGKAYNDPLRDITDICGIRIVTSRTTVVDKIIRVLKGELEIDEKNSVIKSQKLNIDQFGYLSSNLVVSLNHERTRLTEWKKYTDLKAEIQIRTQLQHAWAQISHKFDYKKSADMPAPLHRKLFRLSALFELADEELETISEKMETTYETYASKIGHGDLSEELNIDSLKAYIDKSDVVKYWQEIIRNEPQHKVESWGDLSRDIRIANYIGLSTVQEIDNLLINAKGWGEEFLKKYYEKHFEKNKNRKATTVLNGVVTWLMIATYIEKFPKDILEKEYGISGLASYYIAEIVKNNKA